jgi:hypothetical protein
MIWSKAFIMERERFDGADVMHLIHENANRLDWNRLLERFGQHGESCSRISWSWDSSIQASGTRSRPR